MILKGACLMRKLLLSALVTLAAWPVLAAPGTETAPYKSFYEQMSRFYATDHDRLALRLSILPADGAAPLAAPVTMTVMAPDGAVPLSLDAENVVDIPFRPEWLAADAKVVINQAPGTYRMRGQIGMKLPAGSTQLAYADAKAAFDQFDKLIEKEAGMVSFLAPSARTLRLVCGAGCTVTVEGAKGTRVLKADDKGRVNVLNDKALAKENPVLTASQPIAYTVLTTKD